MPKREKPFHLDMPFGEALRRYAQADPNEVSAADSKVKKKRRVPRITPAKRKPKPPDQTRPT
jgi:hypothetical protein